MHIHKSSRYFFRMKCQTFQIYYLKDVHVFNLELQPITFYLAEYLTWINLVMDLLLLNE